MYAISRGTNDMLNALQPPSGGQQNPSSDANVPVVGVSNIQVHPSSVPPPFRVSDPGPSAPISNSTALSPSLCQHVMDKQSRDNGAGYPGTEIVRAAKEGDVAGVNKCLREGADPNGLDSSGYPALAMAAVGGCVEVVKCLLAQAKIDPNLKHPLLEAAVKAELEIVQLLLEREDIQVNALDEDHDSALMRAAHYGHVEVVKCLLEHKEIDPNLGQPLLNAIAQGHREIVQLLLVHKKSKPELWPDLLRAAAQGHLREVIDLLWQSDALPADIVQMAYRVAKFDKHYVSASAVGVYAFLHRIKLERRATGAPTLQDFI